MIDSGQFANVFKRYTAPLTALPQSAQQSVDNRTHRYSESSVFTVALICRLHHKPLFDVHAQYLGITYSVQESLFNPQLGTFQKSTIYPKLSSVYTEITRSFDNINDNQIASQLFKVVTWKFSLHNAELITTLKHLEVSFDFINSRCGFLVQNSIGLNVTSELLQFACLRVKSFSTLTEYLSETVFIGVFTVDQHYVKFVLLFKFANH